MTAISWFTKPLMLRFILLLAISALGAQAAQPALTLNLVTFNIRMQTEDDGPNEWKHRSDFLYETVREMAPDVMGVQEAFVSQLKDMAHALPGYAYVGVGRDDGKEEGEHAAVFYKKDRFIMKAEGTFWLSDTPHVVASNTWEAACNRVCTWIQLTDKDTQRTFSVYNAHYDHKSEKARQNSPRVILEQMLANQHDKEPLILMGDFNSGPASPQMLYLLDGKAPLTFQNTLPADPSEESATFHGFKGHTKGQQIDYVLIAGSNHRVETSEIVRTHQGERYPSDHYPVLARVTFPTQS